MKNVFQHHSSIAQILYPLWCSSSLPTPLAWLCSPWQEDHYAHAYVHTTNPIFLPYFLPALCDSHSVELQQPRTAWGTASPRHHDTLVLWKSLQHPGPICMTFFVLGHDFECPASMGFQCGWGCPPWHTDFFSEKNTEVRSWKWCCAGNSTLGMGTGMCSPPETLRTKQVPSYARK